MTCAGVGGLSRATGIPGLFPTRISDNSSRFPLQSTLAFDESKTIRAVVRNPMAWILKIGQNVLETADKTRKTRTHEVFDGKA